MAKKMLAAVISAVLVMNAALPGLTAFGAVEYGSLRGAETESSFDSGSKATPSVASPSMANVREAGTTYYVDAADGNDAWAGTSEDKPWKTLDKINGTTFLPGDKILLKSGSAWNGTLHPKGSGEEGSPIVIGSYGEGPKPLINGNGTTGPAITGAVLLYNQEYWEIYNLEVTNRENTDQEGALMDSGTSERAGILIYSSNQEQIYKHIVVKGCYVHDVNSKLTGMKTSGGIIVLGHYMDMDGNVVTVDNNGNLTTKAMGRAAFEDVVLEGNYVRNVAVEGIRNKCNTNINSDGWGKNEFLKNFKNVTIKNNYLQNVVGDGIVLTETVGGLVEGNLVNASCDMDRGTINYAQCWTMFADDIYIQYNEVYGNKYGYDDGEAFDSDMRNINNIFQYNLSHDNAGGACLFMSNQKDTIFRYNVSINDGTGTIVNGRNMQQQTFHYDSTSSNNPGVPLIYNNTIYMGNGKTTSLFGGKGSRTCFINFKNNIVLAENGSTITFSVPRHTDIAGATQAESKIHPDSIIENNCIYPQSIADTNGVSSTALSAKGNIFVDPKLVNPQAGSTYSNFVMNVDNMAVLLDEDYTKDRVRALSEPYMLQDDSPCIYAGQRIEGAPEEDLFGNPITGRVDIGAHEYSNGDETAERVEDVTIATVPGKAPVLPSMLNVVLDSKEYKYPVVWEELSKDQYENPGIVELSGRLPGITNAAHARIVVSDTPDSMEEIEVTTYAGVYPFLPATVKAVFDGNIELNLSVKWETLSVDRYSQAGLLEVSGQVEGLAAPFVAKVHVLGQIGDGNTVESSSVTADAFIQKSVATQNYGSDVVIKVKNANADGYNRRSLVKFDLDEHADLLEEATRITLKLYVTRYDKDANYGFANPERDQFRLLRIYDLPYDSWTETGVNWNNSPSLANADIVVNDKTFVNGDIMDNGNILEVDITDYVRSTGRTKFSFMIGVFNNGVFASGDNSGFDFASKENTSGYPAPSIEVSNVYVTEIEEAASVTRAGREPSLPEKVTVRYSDQTSRQVSVTWEKISKEMYAEEGEFTVNGTVEGTGMPATLHVTVTEAPHIIRSVKAIPTIIALLGTTEEDLGLPQTAVAVLDDGTEMTLPVSYWFPEPAYNPELARDYAYVGHFNLEEDSSIENPDSITAAVTVSLIEPADKDMLMTLYIEAGRYIRSGEVDKLIASAKEMYLDAYEQAAQVLLDEYAQVPDIHNAYQALLEAMWGLDQKKADTQELERYILIGRSKEESAYTADSYRVLTEALEAAQQLAASEITLDRQSEVDEMASNLRAAIEQLVVSGSGPQEPELTLTGIKVSKLPDKLSYYMGEAFNPAGMTVVAVYNDKMEREIRDYEIGRIDMSTSGVKDVVITYKTVVSDQVRTFTATFRITVERKGSISGGGGGSSSSGGSTGSRPAGSQVSDTISGNWNKEGDSWSFTKSDGSKAANEWGRIGGSWYWFGADSKMATGWFHDGKNWYFLNQDGRMLASSWTLHNGIWFYTNANGSMAENQWVMTNGKWYYINERGEMAVSTVVPDGSKVNENGEWIQ